MRIGEVDSISGRQTWSFDEADLPESASQTLKHFGSFHERGGRGEQGPGHFWSSVWAKEILPSP